MSLSQVPEQVVLATVRRSPDGEEWVDLETVRHHAEGVEVARQVRDKTASVRQTAWLEQNPAVRIAQFRLTEIERP